MSSLNHSAVDDAMTYLLVGVVIGRLDARSKHDPEVILRYVIVTAVNQVDCSKSVRQILDLIQTLRTANDLLKTIAMNHHRTAKTVFRLCSTLLP